MLRRAPQVLLGLLFCVLLGFVLTQGEVHGRTFDEPLQNDYGHRVLDWYLSLGGDRGFLDYEEKTQLPQHGPFFETVVAFFQSTLGRVFGADAWAVRSIVCGLTGILGVALMALCALEVARSSRRIGEQGRWWFAFTAAAALALYPRYTGAIFNNSKDLPLAVAMLALLWLTIRLARRWLEEPDRFLWRDLVAVGVVLGLAMAIRVIALLWVPVLGLLVVAWLARDRWTRPHLRRAAIGTGVIGLASYLTILVTWPYIFLNPIGGLPESIASMSKYPWDDAIKFGGEMIQAEQLPRTYVPTWLWQGSPWLTVLLALAGTVLALADLARRRGSAADVLLVSAWLLPVLALVAMRPTLYNGPRHFLFVIPPMLLLAAYGLVVGVGWLLANAEGERWRSWRAWTAGVVVAVALAAQMQVLIGVARIYPYEYMYFNAATGGFEEQHTEFETDYWAVCSREAVLWLEDNWRAFTDADSATVQNRWGVDGQLGPYLPTELEILPEGKPDFGIYTLMDWRRDPWKRFTTIKEFEVDGVVMCTVKVNPDLE